MAIEIDYKPERRPDVFRIMDPTYDESETTPAELRDKLDGILEVASRQSHASGVVGWGAWKLPSETRIGGYRTFSPWFGEFGVPSSKATIANRLHIAFPKGWAPQPIIHIERRVTSSKMATPLVFEGFEVIWNQASRSGGCFNADKPSLAIVGESLYQHISPEDVDPRYWDVASATINLAHKEFVPQEVPLVAAN